MLAKQAGIYKISCDANDKIYVGSSVNVYRRWYARHLPQLRRNKHGNTHLQRAWNKYGADAFTCVLIESCDPTQLIVREQHWMDELDVVATGFNICPIAGSTLGIPQSAKCKAALLDALCKTYVVTSPGGQEQTITNLSQFSKDNNLTHNAMSKVAIGKSNRHNGWQCRYASQTREAWEATLCVPEKPIKVTVDGQVWCSKCRGYKPATEFNKDKQQPSGFAAYCRVCNKRRLNKQYRQRTAGV